MEFFKTVTAAPPDAILGLTVSYLADPRPNKVNLGAGIYRTEQLQPYILDSVKRAEAQILEKETSKDYLPIDGLANYVDQTKELVFEDSALYPNIYGTQTVGGTAALFIGAKFLKDLDCKKVYLSNPTWPNHPQIFKQAGFEIESYAYFDPVNKNVDFATLMQDVEKMESGSIIVLQLCCHNPTGFDLSIQQWEVLFELVRKKELFPFFDCAYQGFGVGLHEDIAPLTLFLRSGANCAVAISHAKNFGLYAERCGALFMVCQDPEEAIRVGSRIKLITRGIYSNPPCHGVRIVSTILSQNELKSLWLEELAGMRARISEMRSQLTEGLLKGGSSQFHFLKEQKGMFSYTGLKESEVDRLIQEFGIYLPKDGRINVAGLNADNLDYVIQAILTVYDPL